MERRRCLLPCALLILLAPWPGLLLPAQVAAMDYYPLTIGYWWEYESAMGVEAREVIGTGEIWGNEVAIIRYTASPENLGLENFWTTTADDDVLLWGFFRDDINWGMLYDPPIPWIDAPLFLGKAWSHTFLAYELPDTTFCGTFVIDYEVYEEGIVSTPAGDFYAYGIGSSARPSLEGHTLSGEISDDLMLRNATNWVSDGVGEVQYWVHVGVPYKLVRYEQPTPVVVQSWGRIRQLCRLP